MFSTSNSEFVNFIPPLHERLKHYDRSSPPSHQPKNDAADPAKAVPKSFIDAMLVREEVFVKEQNIDIANEADDDDPRSFHWVAYASIPAKAATSNTKRDVPDLTKPAPPPTTSSKPSSTSSTSTKIPIGTIRLVPSPHPPHHNDAAGWDRHGQEAYIKLGRLAVIPEFRKAGISKLLIDTALTYAREHPYEVGPLLDPASVEAIKKGGGGGGGNTSKSSSSGTNDNSNTTSTGEGGDAPAEENMAVVGPPPGTSFRGLVLVHSQVGAARVWTRHGFEKDAGMGEWDEEGIQHIGMWRRLDVGDARRKSKIWTTDKVVD